MIRDPQSPSRWRFALLVLIGVYPLITVVNYAIEPLIAGWPIWQCCLVVAPIMVGAMVYGLIPTIQTRFKNFINPGPSRPTKRTQP